MIARMNGITVTLEKKKRGPKRTVGYFASRYEQDQFPDASFLDPLDENQHQDIRQAVDKLVQTAAENCLPKRHLLKLRGILNPHIHVFRFSFSAGPAAKICPLKIELTPDTRPVQV